MSAGASGDRVRAMLRRDPFWLELAAATGTVLWVAWSLAVAGDLDARPSYRIALRDAPEWAWQATGAGLALFKATARLRDWHVARSLAASLAALWWCLLTVCIAAVDATPPGIALYVLLCLMNLVALTVGVARLRAGLDG